MTQNLVRRMSAPVPRYTSYPTAAYFTPVADAAAFARSLTSLRPDAVLSLYAHIPFCSELCWYCGCSTKIVRSREPVAEYVETLKAEIAKVASLLGARRRVSHLHWGGGSPNILSPSDIVDLAEAIHRHFEIEPTAEFAVEIDPRSFTREQAKAFASSGVNRISVGIQDFDPAVQSAINRIQSFELTERCIADIRAAGIASINVDLIYGLPHQTRESMQRTIEQVIKLDPSRIAIFGYAHLPSRAKHQSLIDEMSLPDAVERFAQSQRARRLLKSSGYIPVGLDHFAKAGDPLAQGHVRRNFQGYTTDTASALIGFGASAISQLPDGYFQNAVPRQDYMRRIAEKGLATARGVILTDDDRVRAFVIERLMCDFEFSRASLRREFGDLATTIIEEAEWLLESDSDGLLQRTADGFRLSPRGEPFVRSIAACFDAYLIASSTAPAAAVGV